MISELNAFKQLEMLQGLLKPLQINVFFSKFVDSSQIFIDYHVIWWILSSTLYSLQI